MDLAYHKAADPLNTHTPRDSDDITRFLAGISSMCPRLRVLKVTAIRRAVSVDLAQMAVQHLALACQELTFTAVADSPSHSKSSDRCNIPASLHFLFAAASHPTVSLRAPHHLGRVPLRYLMSNNKPPGEALWSLSKCSIIER